MRVQRLWQSAQHNAFTDLICYHQAWYCVFREGSTHMSLDGKIRVMYSQDAENWTLLKTFDWQGGDLRDPKLSINPQQQLIVSAGIRWAVPLSAETKVYSVGWQFDAHHQAWSEPVLDSTSQGTWRWATTWHQQYAYSVGYAGHDKQGCLYRSKDGLNWQSWVAPFFPDANVMSNEASIAFDGERAYCLLRRDGRGGVKAMLGQSLPPYTEWQWRALNQSIGGPKLLKLSNGEFVAAVRYINYKRWKAKTVIYKLDPLRNRLKPWRVLPSAGDSSYAGLVEQDGTLYVSYYSSHVDDQVSIYLAVIPLIKKNRSRRFG